MSQNNLINSYANIVFQNACILFLNNEYYHVWDDCISICHFLVFVSCLWTLLA